MEKSKRRKIILRRQYASVIDGYHWVNTQLEDPSESTPMAVIDDHGNRVYELALSLLNKLNPGDPPEWELHARKVVQGLQEMGWPVD